MALTTACATHPAAVSQRQERPIPPRPRAPDKAVRQLQADLSAVFGAAIMAHAQWGVVVRSLQSGELLYELNADKLMMPASSMKIVTLAGAARTLSWDYRFITSLETAAPIQGGALEGDLFIRGGGDPTINTRNGRSATVFADWISALRAAGVERIKGRIVGDDQLFDDEGLGGGWAWDYLEAGYAAPVGALQYNEDVAEMAVAPGAIGGEPAIVRLPPGTGLMLSNRAVTGPAGKPETISFRRYLDRPVLEVTGIVPLRMPSADQGSTQPERTVTRQVAVVNPTVYFAQSFKDALVAQGITVDGDAVDFDDVAATLVGAPVNERRVLAKSESAPLSEIAVVLMKVSQNLYAETLLKAMGAASGGLGTAQAGRAAVLGTLREWKIDERSIVMADGSGLSRYNYVTADLLARILEHMYADARVRDLFQATLPIAGKDGTISTRMRRTRAEGNALAKTGSISNVRALSGYVRTRDAEPLVFSILANDFVIPPATVNWIADLGVEVLANFTRKPSP